MKIDVLLPQEIDESRELARALADAGYDGFWLGESRHDPWMQALLAAEIAPTTDVGTAIVVAFARTPMTVAVSAFDLARYTCGRFTLGLGTQVRPHIERRYSMPWSSPVERMRDYIAALRAIWSAWLTEEPLRFRGTFYTHDLMTPVFTPAPHRWGAPPIHLAAVGTAMLELVGEVADGLIVHPFHSASYLRDVIVPTLGEGAMRAGRDARDLELVGSALVATGRDAGEIDWATHEVRRWLSFYSSTPAYQPVLAHHGYGDIHEEMRALSRQGEWATMADRLPSDLLAELAIVGRPEEAAAQIVEKYGSLADRVSLNLTGGTDPGLHKDLVAAIRRS